MKKYTIKEFAEGKKAVKIENEEQWNKLNKVHKLTPRYLGAVYYYDNNHTYTSLGVNHPANYYTKPENGYETLEFSQLDFEEEFVAGKWYKRVEREGYLYQPEYVYYVKCNSTNKKEKGILNYSERINFGGAYTCYNDYCETDNFVQIDLSEIQQFLPPGHSDLIKKDEFVLPEKWCIKLETREISEAVNSIDLWKDGQLVWYDNESYRERWISYDGEYLGKDKIKDYTEITFEEFKTHILKESTMEKEILRYKLVKPEFINAANSLLINSKFVNPSTMDMYQACNIEAMKKAGVLDLWFEPVFAPDKSKLPRINGIQMIDNGNKTLNIGQHTKSFDWWEGVAYTLEEEYSLYIGFSIYVNFVDIQTISNYINSQK